ncbi:MAG: ribonuclease E/G, partial [Polynucleobacter sp.]|nr:ribonuclease E/G [Polynucleobacter sp.]
HVTCPRCNGTGHIRDTESSALQVLRIIQEEAMKDNTAAIHTQVPVEVAAFLLNEKRAEVIKIESRFKVNVLMVPNKHLETPHYKLERLRHDDPRLDDQKASYIMAQEAATELEADTIVSRKEEVKVKPEAAVKGITPSQPAPMNQPRPARASATNEKAVAESSGGFMGFIKKLFTSTPEITVATPEARPRPSGAREGRNGNERSGRNRRGRNERPAAGNAEAGANTETNGREAKPRQEGRGGRNRNSRPERLANPNGNDSIEASQSNAATTESANPETAVATANGEDRPRGRNRRGRGRGQRERGDNLAETTSHESEVNEVIAKADHSAAAPSSTTAPWPPIGMVQMAGNSATAPLQDLQSNLSGVLPIPTETTLAAVTASIAIPTAALPPAAAPQLPRVAFSRLEEAPLVQVVESAGMVWVGTDATKLAEAQTQMNAEPIKAPAKRTPKPAPDLPSGPMVLVETGGQEKMIDKN